MPDNPALSAIVISRDDEDRIERSVRAVLDQECPETFEVIVVTSGRDRTAEIVRDTFPEVRLIVLDQPALPGVARNAGLRIARGDYVTFPGSHVVVPPGVLAARLDAHQQGYDMVTGAIRNGTETPAGWASYFLDHSHSLPHRPPGPADAPPAHCSYRRQPLLAVGGFPEDMRAGEDTVVNRKLFSRGCSAYRLDTVVMTHNSPCRDARTLVRHHFQRGRAMGRIILDEAESAETPGLTARALLYWLFAVVPRRVSETSRNVNRWGADLAPKYRRVYALVVLGATAAWAGLWYELLPGLIRRRSRTERSARRRRRSRR